MNVPELTVNIKVTVNHQSGVAFWRLRWARRLARLFGLPLHFEVEDAK